jgi:hypothetical protein
MSLGRVTNYSHILIQLNDYPGICYVDLGRFHPLRKGFLKLEQHMVDNQITVDIHIAVLPTVLLLYVADP